MRIVAAWAVLVLAGCAQIREPQGGPKDVQAPLLVAAAPPDGSTGFTGQRIQLQFNERIKLEKVREKLLVSPPLAKPPDVRLAPGNQVVIGLNAPLAPNTTYTFNIGEAIADVSEGNTAAGLTYVISTGGHLDSLALHGKVVQAATGAAAADVLVLLQLATDTGDVRTAPPNYFTRTAPDGSFSIGHLPAAPMRIYALRDRNGNYRFDLPNEEVAFMDSLQHPGDERAKDLYLFQPVPAKQFVQAAKVLADGGWQLALAKPAQRFALLPVDRMPGSLDWWLEWGSMRDTVTCWPSDTTALAGQRFAVQVDEQLLDTLTYRVRERMPFNVGVTAKREPGSGRWYLESTRPVGSIEPKRMEMKEDTMVIPVRVDSISGRRAWFSPQPAEGRTVQLTIWPKAITATSGGTNDTLRLTLAEPALRSLGRLKVEVRSDSAEAPAGPFVLYLLASGGRTVRTELLDSVPALVEWSGLAPGNYTLRLVQDSDQNGRWTTGSYVERRQPERVYAETQHIAVRAGWLVEHRWQLLSSKRE